MKIKVAAYQKRIKAIRKSISQIDELVEKQNNGVKLDEQQVAKVGRLEELMMELAQLARADLEDSE